MYNERNILKQNKKYIKEFLTLKEVKIKYNESWVHNIDMITEMFSMYDILTLCIMDRIASHTSYNIRV